MATSRGTDALFPSPGLSRIADFITRKETRGDGGSDAARIVTLTQERTRTMLVLARKQSQRIILKRGTEEIVITTVRIGPGNVRIGVDADKSWNIVREELVPRPMPAEAATEGGEE